MRWCARSYAAFAWLILAPSMVQAQTPAAASSPRFEAAIGGRLTGTIDLGESAANEIGASGGQTRLFVTHTRLKRSIGLEGRVGVALARRIKVEGSVSYGTTELNTKITSDAEGVPTQTATEPVKQLQIYGELVAYLKRPNDRSRATPFVIGGVGYLRQLFSAQTLALTGQSYFLGGGFDCVLDRSIRTLAKEAGVRLDGRVILNSGGVALNHDRWVGPSAGASLFFRF